MGTAVKLLRENNGDILACEQEFHAENINHINIITDCGIETARESYNHCNYDIKKAVEKINSRQLIITTRKNAVRKNEIGFILWPESKEGGNYKSEMRNDVFIPTDDFDYIIDEFKSVFPLEDP